MKIRLLVWCEGYVPKNELHKLDSQSEVYGSQSSDYGVRFTDFVLSEVNKNKLLQSFEDSLAARLFKKIEDFVFDLPDNLDEQFIRDICVGRACSLWFERNVDLGRHYHRSWSFIEKNNKWELRELLF